jgi:hypothetical protein
LGDDEGDVDTAVGERAADAGPEPGTVVTLDRAAAPSVGVFSVAPAVTFTVQNLTVANGTITGTTGTGGAIVNRGTSTVTNSTFSNNSAFLGGRCSP